MFKKKILVVDDELDTLEILDKRLTAEGYCVIKASEGQEALEIVKEVLPDLILLDIVLPDMDGSDVVEALRNNPETRRVPILFISGILSKAEDNKLYIKVGGRLYNAIAKPLQPAELLAGIKKFLPT